MSFSPRPGGQSRRVPRGGSVRRHRWHPACPCCPGRPADPGVGPSVQSSHAHRAAGALVLPDSVVPLPVLLLVVPAPAAPASAIRSAGAARARRPVPCPWWPRSSPAARWRRRSRPAYRCWWRPALARWNWGRWTRRRSRSDSRVRPRRRSGGRTALVLGLRHGAARDQRCDQKAQEFAHAFISSVEHEDSMVCGRARGAGRTWESIPVRRVPPWRQLAEVLTKTPARGRRIRMSALAQSLTYSYPPVAH